jgi:hypothetical protein
MATSWLCENYLIICGVLQQEEEADVYFQPVIKLTEKVEAKTLEEDELDKFQAFVLIIFHDQIASTLTAKYLAVPSYGDMMPVRARLQNGRNVVQATFVCSSTKKKRRGGS